MRMTVKDALARLGELANEAHKRGSDTVEVPLTLASLLTHDGNTMISAYMIGLQAVNDLRRELERLRSGDPKCPHCGLRMWLRAKHTSMPASVVCDACEMPVLLRHGSVRIEATKPDGR